MSESGDRDDAIGTEAAHWLATMRGPDADGERPAFEAWRDRDPRHAQAYADAQALFALTRGAKRTPYQPDETAEMHRVRQASGTAGRRRYLRPIGIAAGLSAIIAVGTISFTARGPTGDAGAPPQAVSTATTQLKRYADGTLVLLGACSLVTADLGDAVHQFALERGRARFIGSPPSASPLVIVIKGHRVTTRGATVDIAIEGTSVRVTAVSGSAELGAGSAPARTLTPGQTVVLSGDAAPVAVAASDSEWPPVRLSFDTAPLADVAAVANSFGGKPLHIDPAEMGRLRITGTFDVRDTAALARKIAAALDLRVSEDGRRITLRSHAK